MVELGLFSKSEVSLIMKKRTDFEHRLNSRGSSIQDYIKYINYETSVEKLRQKRVKRILQSSKKNTISDWSIQQRIAFIYQRGCNKFPSELKFWAKYLNYLKTRGNQTSYKKIHKVYNELIRLHPSNPEVWISCAKYEYEVHANFKSCRMVFQNALRFNPEVFKLWYEYIKFELNFITKLINRRKVMGLISEREQELDMLKEAESHDNQKGANEEGDSKLTAPSTGNVMKDKLNELPEADMNMLGNDQTNPALRGDIALAIFDVAIKTLSQHYMNRHKGYYDVSDPKTLKELRLDTTRTLFEKSMELISLFDEFEDLQRDYLINHVLEYWKNEHEGIQLQNDIPQLHIDIIFLDITLNIRYMSRESLDVEKLQLSVNKYFAYKSRLDESSGKKIKEKYTEFIRENYLSKMSPETDESYNILELIAKKL